MTNAEQRGIVLLCDADGTILRVVRDNIGLSGRASPGSRIYELVDVGAREKFAAFLAELQAQRAAYDWEITVPVDGILQPLHVAGALLDEAAYLVVAACSPEGVALLHHELMQINNEQTNALRSMAKGLSAAVAKSGRHEDFAYEQLGRLNNEMVNLQRELAKKNAELQRYYVAAEEEQELASHLMSRLVRLDLLQDPLFTSWIQPAHNLSGDLIAAARTPAGVLHVLLADGTGHGLAASLSVLPMVDPFYAMSSKGLGVGVIAAEINRKIGNWLPAGRFVAAALIAFDPRSMSIEVWCGGLPPPFLLDERGQLLFEFSSLHLPFGVLSCAEFDARTEAHPLLGPEQLIVCSDGVTEAVGADGSLFGTARLLASLREVPAGERLGHLKSELAKHFSGRSPHDDLSVAIVDCVCSPALS